MKNVVLVDFPEKWPSLLPQLTQNLQSQVHPTAAKLEAKSGSTSKVLKRCIHSVCILATCAIFRQMQVV